VKLLELLQRGRGEGYLRALALDRPTAAAAILECLTNDPRLDRQCEARADYYASLAIELGVGLEPIARIIRDAERPDNEDEYSSLSVRTLVALAKRNYGNAADIFCDYVNWGSIWQAGAHELDGVPYSCLHERVAQAIEGRFLTDEYLEGALVGNLTETLWTTLGFCSARIRKLAEKWRTDELSRAATAKAPLDFASLTITQLLEHAGPDNCIRSRDAIAGIVRPSDVDFLVENVSVEKPYAAAVALAGLASLARRGYSIGSAIFIRPIRECRGL
jgi:hypothetical protein